MNLPFTLLKIQVAKSLYWLLSKVIPEDKVRVTRGKINYELDISEGIDLSIFLFGNFQNHVLKAAKEFIQPDSLVLDIGANIGSFSLKAASLVTKGKIISVEPTDYAFQKFKQNLELNPELARSIKPIQAFCSHSMKESNIENLSVYSSWKLKEDGNGKNRHPLHGGQEMSASGADLITLDHFLKNEDIEHLDFIKIDTDGNELDVLKSGSKLLQKFKPAIVFEITQYTLSEKEESFSDYYKFLSDLDYEIRTIGKRDLVTIDNFKRYIPQKHTVDLLAIPNRYLEN